MALSTNRKTMDGDREFVQLAKTDRGASPHRPRMNTATTTIT